MLASDLESLRGFLSRSDLHKNSIPMTLDNPSAERQRTLQFLNDFNGVKAFERGKVRLQHLPVEVHLQLTSTCNLDCVMCSEHLRPGGLKGRKLLDLDETLFEKLEREVLPYSAKLMLGVGGEPMLSRSFFDYIKRGREWNQEIHLTTNSTRITTDEAARTLAECVHKIEISIDGATPETYERIRNGASFEKLIENIERLNRFRLLDPPGKRCLLTICMVLMRSNVHELTTMLRLAKRLHVERVAAWHVIPVTEEGRADSLIDHKQLSDRTLKEAHQLAQEIGIEVDFPAYFDSLDTPAVVPAEQSRAGTVLRMQDQAERPKPAAQPAPLPHAADSALHQASPAAPRGSRLRCHMPTLAAYVLYDGRVFACGHPHGQDKMLLGNLRESSFAEIWNGAPAQLLRAGLASGSPPPVCQSCSIMQSPPPALEELDGHELGLEDYYSKRPLDRSGELVDYVLQPRSVGSSESSDSVRPGDSPTTEARAVPSGELDLLVEQVHRLEQEREQVLATIDQFAEHLRNVETDRVHLLSHIAERNKETEQLYAEIGKLQRILAMIHGLRIYRALRRVKGFFGRAGAGVS